MKIQRKLVAEDRKPIHSIGSSTRTEPRAVQVDARFKTLLTWIRTLPTWIRTLTTSLPTRGSILPTFLPTSGETCWNAR